VNTFTGTIAQVQKQQYQDEGYFFLERVIPEVDLEMLREECQYSIDKLHAEMDAASTDVVGLSHRHRRYFTGMFCHESPRLHAFVRSELMAEICRATIGPDAYLSNEFFVIKGAEEGLTFAWHQDGGYGVDFPVPPYVVCWIPLDDMTEENGTIYVLPYSRAGTREHVEHTAVDHGTELVGYFGADPGIPAVVAARSIVVFSGTTLHRSGPNATPRLRRAYTVRYTPYPVGECHGTLHAGKDWYDEPFLKDGRWVPA
jgi:ectoine hydroxylase-related dioxygenase (phytanoyl-CoA dioxygenase family)